MDVGVIGLGAMGGRMVSALLSAGHEVIVYDVSAAAVERALRAGAGPLLESIWLFDLYTGPQIGEGKKSLAYALRFRAPDRTLTDAEAAEARDAAVAEATERTGAVQRTV